MYFIKEKNDIGYASGHTNNYSILKQMRALLVHTKTLFDRFPTF